MRSLFLLVLIASPLQARTEPPSFELRQDPKSKSWQVVVIGLHEDLFKEMKTFPSDAIACEKVVRVVVGSGSDEEIAKRPTIAGRWFFDKQILVFEPKYPLTRNTVYHVALNIGESKLTRKLSLPKLDLPPTQVAQVYPTAKKLPENQLKFYIHFSGSMGRGDAYDHIQLLNEEGKVIEDAFLVFGDELWDRECKRFTLWINPGRIKKGLKPREDLGPVLEEGKSYTLVVKKDWKDANADELKSEYRKTFTVGPQDTTPPDENTWKITAPKKVTEAVQIKFPESMDHALMNRVIWVVDPNRNPIEGSIEVSDEETVWRFTPKQNWKPGKYRIVVETILEDLVGNGVGRQFEVDPNKSPPKTEENETIELLFVVPAK
jgi:hypothetical protein